MSELSIEIQGLKEVQRNAEKVAREISHSGNLVAKAALVVERQAKINATGRPGPKVKTGRLRASITIAIRSPVEATVGTNVFYAPFVEFGHSQTPGQFVPPLKKRLVASFAPAYPFMSPVPEQVKGQLDGVMVSFGNDLGAIWNK